MATPRRSDRLGLLLWLKHDGEASLPPAHGARCGSRRDDRQARGHAARGRPLREASGALPAADVEPAGGAMTTWLRRQLEGLGR